MKTTAHWLSCFVCILALLAPACSGSSDGDEDGNNTQDTNNGDDQDQQKKVEDFMPASGEIPGWEEDTSQGEPGLQAAYTRDDGELLINGALDPFTDTGKWVGMVIEYYINGDMSVELHLYEVEDAATMEGVYAFMETHPDGTPWEAEGPGLGDESRWADQGPYWLLHVRVGKYLILANFRPGDDTGKEPAKAFVGAVVDKLP
jgi:hypothetical protein